MTGMIETDGERFRRLHGEAIRGAKLALECFAALREIRDDELWRQDGWESFDAYLRENFSFTRGYANKLIAAVEVKAKLESMAPDAKDLSNEGQLREIRAVPEDKLLEVWGTAKEISEAEGKGRVTAKDLRAARRKVLGQKVPKRVLPEKPVEPEVRVEESLASKRVKRIAAECLDRLELQLSHLMLRERWQGTLDKIRMEVSRS